MEPIGPFSEADRRAIREHPDDREGRPPRVNFAMGKSCAQVMNHTGLDRLTPRTRRRHFILPWLPLWCSPIERFDAMLANERPLWYSLEMDPLIGPDLLRGHLQVPFLSNIRWSAAHDARGEIAPWRSASLHPERRDVLMSFGGSLDGSELAQALRKAVAATCAKANEPRVCTAKVGDPGTFGFNSGDGSLEEVMTTKQRSIFCVEPPGHGPVRKALNDAYLCGCIPVLFITEAQFGMLWPLHLSGWGRNATVLLPATKFLSGELDLVHALRSLYEGPGWSPPPPGRPPAGGWGAPSSAVRSMQATLAAHGHHLHYSLDQNSRGDAADTLTRGLARALANPSSCRALWPNSWRCTDEQFALERRAAIGPGRPGRPRAGGLGLHGRSHRAGRGHAERNPAGTLLT